MKRDTDRQDKMERHPEQEDKQRTPMPRPAPKLRPKHRRASIEMRRGVYDHLVEQAQAYGMSPAKIPTFEQWLAGERDV